MQYYLKRLYDHRGRYEIVKGQISGEITLCKIESIKDKEEALFLSNLTHLFGELERYTAFNEVNNEIDEVAFNFELATSQGDFKSSRTYRLPKTKLAEVEKIKNKMQTLLSGNDELDICILLKMLNEKLR